MIEVPLRNMSAPNDRRCTTETASHLGLLSHASSVSAPSAEHDAIAEKIVLSAKGEIEATAEALAQVKALKEHVNPPYLRGDGLPFTARSMSLRAFMFCTSDVCKLVSPRNICSSDSKCALKIAGVVVELKCNQRSSRHNRVKSERLPLCPQGLPYDCNKLQVTTHLVLCTSQTD